MESRVTLGQVLAQWSQDSSSSTPPNCEVPFLKWAGGKRWLRPLAPHLEAFAQGKYIEPFLGSAAMFFALRPRSSILSDTNQALIETYQTIQDDWRGVWRHLLAHDRHHSEEHYYKVRSQSPKTVATRAAQFIYLNRTCWNGLYRVNRHGQFNVPIGSKVRARLKTDDFSATAIALRNAELVCGDFATSIDRAGSGDLIFADPPYTVRHQFNGFVKYNQQLFSWEDQERLCAALVAARSRGATIVCTNADHESIRQLYGEHFEILSLSRFSSIAGRGGTRGKYAEVLIYGQGGGRGRA